MAGIINLLFDGLLVKQQIVCNSDYASVHSWMDKYCTYYHSQNSDIPLDVNEIKLLIISKAETRDAVVLSDYLRVALGHILLASMSDGFAFSSDFGLMKTAFQVFIDRNFNNCTIDLNTLVNVEYPNNKAELSSIKTR